MITKSIRRFGKLFLTESLDTVGFSENKKSLFETKFSGTCGITKSDQMKACSCHGRIMQTKQHIEQAGYTGRWVASSTETLPSRCCLKKLSIKVLKLINGEHNAGEDKRVSLSPNDSWKNSNEASLQGTFPP